MDLVKIACPYCAKNFLKMIDEYPLYNIQCTGCDTKFLNVYVKSHEDLVRGINIGKDVATGGVKLGADIFEKGIGYGREIEKDKKRGASGKRNKNMAIILTCLFTFLLLLLGTLTWLGIFPSSDENSSNILRTEQAFERGRGFLEQLNFNQAVLAFEEILQIDPNHYNAKQYLAESFFRRGYVHLRRGAFNQAIVDFEAALHNNPNHHNARANLALAREQAITPQR